MLMFFKTSIYFHVHTKYEWIKVTVCFLSFVILLLQLTDLLNKVQVFHSIKDSL